MVECGQAVSTDGTKLGEFRSVGNRKDVLFHPTEGISITYKLKSSLDTVVKSPFPTNDAICNKLGMIGYLELSRIGPDCNFSSQGISA